MYDNWSEVRTQLDHVLELERAQRKAQRRQSGSFWQVLRQWRPRVLSGRKLRTPSPAYAELIISRTI